ncbi:MAG: TadE/TadG family type IV pilus assembly protein [Vulcanimicrobiaceae bacterium]
MRNIVSRGNTLPETAIILAVALMMMLGALQIALYGFGQASADGAAFVASNSFANGGATPEPMAASVFPGIAQNNIVLSTPRPGVVIGTATTTMPGLAFVPGMPSSLPIAGADIEPLTSTAQGGPPPPFTFSVKANLKNYCTPTSLCPYPAQHCMYLAQALDNSGNGKNGQFSEWYYHANTFASVSWPRQRPSSIAGSNLDPGVPGSTENTIYSWDASVTTC